MKTCIRCKVEKPKSEFGRLTKSKDGLAYYCKQCNRERQAIRMQNPENRKAHNERNARYRKTEKGKATKRRYYHSDKGQATVKRWQQKAKEQGKAQARQAVNHAIESGYLKRASECICTMNDGTCEGPMEYHHENYSPSNWLRVAPLCRKHHNLVQICSSQ